MFKRANEQATRAGKPESEATQNLNHSGMMVKIDSEPNELAGMRVHKLQAR